MRPNESVMKGPPKEDKVPETMVFAGSVDSVGMPGVRTVFACLSVVVAPAKGAKAKVLNTATATKPKRRLICTSVRYLFAVLTSHPSTSDVGQ